MREYALVALLAMVLTTPRLAGASGTPFSLGEQGGIILPVLLNGEGPFKMLLDTGATHSAITEDLAAALGAKVIARTNVISPAGARLRPIVAIDSLMIGPVKVDVILPSVAPSDAFDPKGEIKGLIGQDVLASLRYTIDFKRRVIEWHEQSPRPIGTRLRLSFEHGRFLVTLPQRGEALRLVPDSGAGGLVLFASGRGMVDLLDTGRTVELRTGAGGRSGRVMRIPALRIGDRTLRDVDAVSIGGETHPAAGDGLLPLHLFGRVTFDGPSRLLILG
jgi:predicted aspartyl protease